MFSRMLHRLASERACSAAEKTGKDLASSRSNARAFRLAIALSFSSLLSPVVPCAVAQDVTDLLDLRETTVVRAHDLQPFDLASPLAGQLLRRGFYPVERGPGGPASAWMGRAGLVVLVLAAPADRSLVLTGRGGPAGLEIEAFWNGASLGVRPVPQQPAHLLWPLPSRHQRSGFNLLELRASAVARFPPDPRRLSFSLQGIELRGLLTSSSPAPSAPPESVGAAVLAPGESLVAPARLRAAPRLLVEAAGAPPWEAGWQILSTEGIRAEGRAVPHDRAGAALRIDPGVCCDPEALLALHNPGPERIEIASLNLIDDDRPAPWRRACGLPLLEAVSIAALVALLLLAARRERPLLTAAPWLEGVLVVAVALLIRALLFQAHPPSEAHGFADSHGYFTNARRLLETGTSFWADTVWHRWFHWLRPPGYFAFVAAVFKLTGGTVWEVGLVQVALLSLVAGAVYLTALPLFGRGAALAAGLVVALDPHSVTSPLWIMSEPLFVVFVALGLAALAKASTEASWPASALAGLALGLAALVRSGPGAFVPLAAAALIAGGRRRGVRPALALLAGFVLTVLPWCVRNSVLYGHAMGVADITLHNLIQHNPDEELVPTEGLDLDTRNGRQAYRGKVAKANADGSLSRQGTAILAGVLLRLARDPVAAGARFVRNLGASVSPYPATYVEQILGTRTTCRVLLLTDLSHLVNWLTLGLAAVGIAASVRRPSVWPVLLWLPVNLVAINLFFVPTPRYVFTVSPVLAVFAGAGCLVLGRLIRRTQSRMRRR